MKRSEKILEKLAEEGRRYPISRFYHGYGDVASLGLSKFVHNRAAQGRVNIGAAPVSKSEAVKLDALSKQKDGKTYPISRTLTSPAFSGTLGAIGGVVPGVARRSPLLGAVGAATGAGAGYFGQAMARDTRARADIGKANIGRKGYTARIQDQLKQLRKADLDKNYSTRSDMDVDTAKNIAGYVLSGIGRGVMG